MFPVLCRYMEQEFIDEFFETGRLRLSSFRAFSKHADELRFDDGEGEGLLQGKGDQFNWNAKVRIGVNSYVFCASNREDDSLMEDFEVDGYFKIRNSMQFGLAVARHIPFFSGGIEGPCRYVGERALEWRDSRYDQKEFYDGKDPMNVAFNEILSAPKKELLFLKPKKYFAQCEYRWVWHTRKELEDDHLFIECPEAIKYCEKVT